MRRAQARVAQQRPDFRRRVVVGEQPQAAVGSQQPRIGPAASCAIRGPAPPFFRAISARRRRRHLSEDQPALPWSSFFSTSRQLPGRMRQRPFGGSALGARCPSLAGPSPLFFSSVTLCLACVNRMAPV